MSKLSLVGIRDITFYLSHHTTKAFSGKSHLLTKLFLSAVDRDDKIIFLCREQMKYLKKYYLPENKNNLIINNGIDTEHFNPKKISSYQDFGGFGKNRYCFY